MITKGVFIFKGYEWKEGGKPFEMNGRTLLTKEKYRIKLDDPEHEYKECYADCVKENNIDLFNKIPSILSELKTYCKLELTFDLDISKNSHTLVDIQQVMK